LTSLSKKARVAGLLYIVASAVGYLRLIYISSALIVTGNAAATASNIAAHETLFRWGIVSYLLASVLFLFVTFALYQLLEGVDRGLAIVMVILGGLMVTPLFFVNAITDAGALMFARGADFLSVFDKPQRDAFVVLFLNLHHQLDLADAIFWGIWLVPFGLLVYRSRFLPRFLGVWLMLGCFGYLAFSFAGFLFPAYEDKLFTIGTPFRMGELATMLWLVIMGAREPRAAATKS
jgi:uncharacterized protein DUF4386